MQNKYVGDIGDYLKLGLLRALSPGRRLGVAWWLHPDGGAEGDGRHTGYLQGGLDWRIYDPALFDRLKDIVGAGNRVITALEDQHILPGASFASEQIPIAFPPSARPVQRAAWFDRVKAALAQADLVFADPDNGIEPAGYNATSRDAGKSITWNELAALRAPGRALIVYHHQTRFKGGHIAEIGHLARGLRERGFASIDAVRASPYSPRVFFLLDADAELKARAAKAAEHWQGRMSWHADVAGAEL